MAGPGPVDGDHQPPPVLRRQGRDRVIEHLQVIVVAFDPAPPRRSIPASASSVLSQ